jgi:hypothetical protein
MSQFAGGMPDMSQFAGGMSGGMPGGMPETSSGATVEEVD